MEAWSAYIEGTLPDDWSLQTQAVNQKARLDAILAELAGLAVLRMRNYLLNWRNSGRRRKATETRHIYQDQFKSARSLSPPTSPMRWRRPRRPASTHTRSRRLSVAPRRIDYSRLGTLQENIRVGQPPFDIHIFREKPYYDPALRN